MTNLQQIRDVLQGQYGFTFGQEGDPPATMFDIANLSSQDIATRMSELYGLESLNVDPNIFGTFDIKSLLPTTESYWSPEKLKYTSPLTRDVTTAMEGTQARKAAGGFSSTSAYTDFAGGIGDEYGRKMGGVMSDIKEKRAKASSSVSDIMQSWDDIMLELSGSST